MSKFFLILLTISLFKNQLLSSDRFQSMPVDRALEAVLRGTRTGRRIKKHYVTVTHCDDCKEGSANCLHSISNASERSSALRQRLQEKLANKRKDQGKAK